MGNFKSIAAGLCLALAAMAMTTASALSAPITVPTGLNPGDQYRLAFVTSTSRDATSTDINDYNLFVDNRAESISELAALAQDWKAIVSTSTIAARDNTSTNPTPAGPTGVPIYLLDGNRLADNYDDLWDSTIATLFNIDETGNSIFSQVWTGTLQTGEIEPQFQPLGAGIPAQSPRIIAGSTFNANGGWIRNIAFSDPNLELPIFAISGVLQISSIPEPAPLGLMAISLVGLVAIRRKRALRIPILFKRFPA